MTGRPGVLLVEAEREPARALAEQLLADGYDVRHARTTAHARALARQASPGLALLGELAAPHEALSLLEEIRGSEGAGAWDRGLPTIVLAPRARELDVLRAFEAGADDFVDPAAGYLELRARLRALVRRAHAGPGGTASLRVEGLSIDPRAHTVSVDGRTVDLRRLEFDLLMHLAREPRRVFSKQELLAEVWGYRASGRSRTVDSHASRLRRKLNEASRGRWVINVWGIGYRLI